MKFIHMADVHIGGWREHALSQLSVDAFTHIIDKALSEHVDFVIIAGDLFNTALPAIEYMKEIVVQLKRLADSAIPVYIIPGSHDYSPSGKTMISVLEKAGLVVNVARATQKTKETIQLELTQDSKTKAYLTGIMGKRNMLDTAFYKSLDTENLKVDGFKIFLFHTALDELKPESMTKMESAPVSLLPSGFDYYAGGHVHIVAHRNLPGYKNVIYPGPVFPNSFAELEKLRCGSYYLYDNGIITLQKIKLKEIVVLTINCTDKTPEQISHDMHNLLETTNVTDAIVLIRLSGKLKTGRLADIGLSAFITKINEKGAYAVLKNISSVITPEFEELKKNFSAQSIEDAVIDEHIGQTPIDNLSHEDEKSLIVNLLSHLSIEKQEGETNTTYEERVCSGVNFIEKS